MLEYPQKACLFNQGKSVPQVTLIGYFVISLARQIQLLCPYIGQPIHQHIQKQACIPLPSKRRIDGEIEQKTVGLFDSIMKLLTAFERNSRIAEHLLGVAKAKDLDLSPLSLRQGSQIIRIEISACDQPDVRGLQKLAANISFRHAAPLHVDTVDIVPIRR